jgi:LuxR family quorum sensing-dependent transcriptional regulator
MFSGDAYSKRTLDFVEQMQRLTKYDDICRHITEELRWYGFSCVTTWSLPGPGEHVEDGFLLNNRPPEYVARYEEKNYVNLDPVVTELRTTSHPFSWGDVRSRRRLTKAQTKIIDEAREFDARDGLIVPIITRSGNIALFSPCGREVDLSQRARAALEIVGIYSFHALQRALVERRRIAQKRPPLTPREREVMHWVAVGKTDDEIGGILSISTTTVTGHVENAKRKLDAVRRTYAVVQAIRLGEIAI